MLPNRRQVRCIRVAACLAALCWLVSAPTVAQQTPAGAASGVESTPSERAQRDADKVFKWILIHADKPRKPSPTRDDKRDEKREERRDERRDERREDKRDEKPVIAARAKSSARIADAAPAGVAAAAPVVSSAPAAAPIAEPLLPVSTATAVAPIAPIAVVEARTAVPSAAPADATDATAAIAAIDEILTPLFRAEPQFPTNLLRTLRKGTVQLQFTVLSDGSVAEAAVVTSTNARLNQSALAAIAQWRFAPLRKPQPGLVAIGFDLD